MKRYQKLIMEWEQLNELIGDVPASAISPGGHSDVTIGALLGAGVGAGASVAKYFKLRNELGKELIECNGDQKCIESVKIKISQLLPESMGRGLSNILTGALYGGAGGAINQFAKGAEYHQNALNNNVGTVDILKHAAYDVAHPEISSKEGLEKNHWAGLKHVYDTGQGRSWIDVMAHNAPKT